MSAKAKEAMPLSLADLSEGERARALKRFQQLRPYLEGELPLTQVAEQESIALRTARRWVTLYRQEGLPRLGRKPRADTGNRQLSVALEQIIEGLILKKPRLSIAAVHRQVLAIATKQEENPPSYSSVYALVKRMEPALLTLAHEGPKVYSETFDLLHRREAEAPNAVWQADHTELDIWLLDERGQPKKAWLTIILDDYSRAVAGYFLSFSAPSALLTALALRQAIWRKAPSGWHICGIPAQLYTDHGSDFTSLHIEQVAADLKMQLIFSGIGKPRGRGKIERFFETITQLLLTRLLGYAPSGMGPMPPKLTLSELDQEIENFLVHEYNLTSHSTTGMAPQTRWEAGGFLPQMPETLEQLDLLLLTVAKARRIHQDGIRFQGLRYIDLNLAAYIGEEVMIRYDPRDMAEIRVYYQNRFLCRAICQELAGQTLGIKQIAKARNERRQQLQRKIKDRRSLVDVLVRPLVVSEMQNQEVTPITPSHSTTLKRYHNE